MNDITDKEFIQIRDYINDNFGISLGIEKKSLVYSRLRSTIQELGLSDFTQYFKYLTEDKSGEAVVKFIDKITTNHTYFMRETDHFDYLRDTVLPYIQKTYDTQKDLRLWCAGCSSGEEAYTLQMIVNDHFKNITPKWDTQILATDISTQVLDKAVAGIYSNDSVGTLPDKWRKEYFKSYDGTSSIVCDDIKKNVTYRKFNFMEERFPFKRKFQVIFCRNVMIYFDNQTRDALVKRFYDCMEPGGYFFIGHSESLNHTSTEFKYVKPALYRKP